MADFKERSFPITQGERLIRLFSPSFLFLNFILIPALGVVFLVLNYNTSNFFFLKLIYSIILVYCLGGFFVLTMNMWMGIDEDFIDYMKNKWKATPLLQKFTVKLIIPEGFKRTVFDGKPFYRDLAPINPDARNHYERYYEGRSFYDITYDYIMEDGKLQIYLTSNLKRRQLIEGLFKKHYPEIKLEDAVNPYKNWPKTWNERGDFFKDYAGMESCDYQLLKGVPLFMTLGEPVWYGDKNNPLSNLFNAILDLDPKAKVIWQLVLRKTGHPDKDKWEREIAKMKVETLSSNTSFVSGSNSMASGDLITQDQKDFFNYLDFTLGQTRYQCRIKMVLFYPPGKQYYFGMIEKMVRAFASEIRYGNTIEKDWFTSTDRFFLENGFMDDLIGPLANRYYHRKEIEFRRQAQYVGLIKQHLDMSHDSRNNFVLGVESIGLLNTLPWIPTNKKVEETMEEAKIVAEVQSAENSFNKLDEIRKVYEKAKQQSQAKETNEVLVEVRPVSTPQAPPQAPFQQDLPDNLPT